MRKFLSLLLALTLALSLTACGGSSGSGGGDSQNETVYTLGDFQIEYKGAEIAPDDDGVTSVIVTLGFTNNSRSASRYGFSMYQKAEQAGEFMLAAALNSVSDEGYMKEIEPGETVDVITGFNLNAADYQGNLNYTDEIKLSIEDADSGKSCTITIDPAALSETDGSGASSGEGGGLVAGSVDGFGDFTSVLVPEGYTFERDSWNEENPHFVSVKKSDWTYFDLHNYTDEASLRQSYESNKKSYTSEQIDVSANCGGIDWTGFQYSDGMGGYGFEVYAIFGSNYLKVSSSGHAFDDPVAQAMLGSVIMADGTGSTTGASILTGVDRTDTEVSGGYDGSMEWLRYWTGDWYGWWLVTDGTGLYAEWNDGAGGGVYDVCARIEAYESMTGYMVLWDNSGSDCDPVASIDVCFANPDDTEFGVMGCNGGRFIGDTLEEGAWYINPDEFIYENIIDFDGDYEDEDGTFSYRVLLRPWGIEWDDMDESLYPEQYYYDWYLPLVEAGAAMPETIG